MSWMEPSKIGYVVVNTMTAMLIATARWIAIKSVGLQQIKQRLGTYKDTSSHVTQIISN